MIRISKTSAYLDSVAEWNVWKRFENFSEENEWTSLTAKYFPRAKIFHFVQVQ